MTTTDPRFEVVRDIMARLAQNPPPEGGYLGDWSGDQTRRILSAIDGAVRSHPAVLVIRIITDAVDPTTTDPEELARYCLDPLADDPIPVLHSAEWERTP